MPEFRRVPEADTETFRDLVRYAFRPEAGPPDDEDEETPAAWEVGTRYGLYDDGDLRTVCKLVDFETRVRGDVHALDGLSAVASPPESRRQGYVRDLLAGALRESRENDVHLSALWPFKRTFYGQYGWATCSRGVEHECDPGDLAFARDRDGGEFVRLDADDWERMDAVHDAHGERYELTMDRTEEWWRKRVLTGWGDDPYAYGFERDGDLAAYVVYDVDGEDDGKVLRAQDVAAVDHDAMLALLQFYADHDSQVDRVRFWTPADADLMDVIPDADDVEASLHVGPMFRLVDVPAALEALSYPESVAGSVTLAVADPLADWNDETFRLSVADGEGRVEPTADDPAVKLGVGALSQLYVGYRSAEELATVGDLAGGDEAADFLASAFPERPTLLREGF
ncbi:GNAT family N-acetyltransferase [Halobacterium litoreum]|uniref:Enhanced intracellular survival protein Eis n=1 Tax=Halobacterium litoreum TaxID=2039234 RepID=A0ABD5NAR5_9EURY|nr:GNAT family N-acetyltransferase [Halobacterium litoreum]UHH12042.1 GNAT family N-acetyltransferase [Halobacterium litoreum]